MNWSKAFLSGLAEFAIILATIQLSPIILPASENKVLAFVIPLVILVLGIFLLKLEKN